MIRLIFAFVLFSLIEFYAYQGVKTLVKTKEILWSYLAISFGILLFLIYAFSKFDRAVGQTQFTLFTMGLMLVVYLPKIIFIIPLILEDLFRIFQGIFRLINKSETTSFLADRRKFVSQIGLGLAAVPFFSLLYGIFEGRYNFKVFKHQISFPDLPEAFDGFTITHISDIHSGSFDNPEKINYAIDLINQQNSDLFLFTGDIVNTHATEMDPWIETFSRIKKHPFGNFSVLGNHDYGEYVTWTSQAAKAKNFEDIKNIHPKIGFKLLLNEHVYIEKESQKIALVGVENWGHNFKKAGDIQKASEGISVNDFKILMSHDPSHWEMEVKKHPKNYHLTLAGHTHGMQFGIEIPGVFKWSLAQYVYKQWAGLYQEFGRVINVNRGFGFHAYPGRVGILPEITVIKLKKAR